MQKEYAIYTGVKRGKNWDEFKKENEDVTIITNVQEQQAKKMQQVWEENRWANELIEGGEAEKTLCVEIDRLPIKVRADSWKFGQITDLKTTGYGVTLEEVQSTILKYDYDLSAALYVDAFITHTGVNHDFYFAFIGKSPMGVEVYRAHEDLIENGRRKYKAAIRRIVEAKQSGEWFNQKVQDVRLPTGSEWHG